MKIEKEDEILEEDLEVNYEEHPKSHEVEVIDCNKLKNRKNLSKEEEYEKQVCEECTEEKEERHVKHTQSNILKRLKIQQ